MKRYKIRATVKHVGMYMDYPTSPVYNLEYAHNQISDMLRHDSGVVENEKREGDEMVFIIICDRFTPRRWQSFGIEAHLISYGSYDKPLTK